MSSTRSTVVVGSYAEQVVADHMVHQGFVLLDRNWRRRECEVDIVARKDDTVYLVEVKYRSRNIAGSGLEYIGPQKIRQMEYAARRWIAENHWSGPYSLAAAEVSGDTYEITAFIDCIY